MAEQNYSAVDFNDLPGASDGKTILYSNGQVCKSEKELGELIGEETSGKLDISAFKNVSGNFALSADVYNKNQVYTQTEIDEKLANFGGFEVVQLDEQTGKPNVTNPSTKIIYLTKEEGSTKTDPYTEWIYTDDGSTTNWEIIGETTVEVDLTNYYIKTETSGANEISAALDLKEDKVFIAEYNVTSYADIKEAYDAGKQIVCKYVENEAQTKFIPLSQYIEPANIFIFAGWATNGQSIYVQFSLNGDGIHTDYQVISNMYYNTSEISGSQELTDAFNTKQDKLTFAGENNTITSINTSAVGGGGGGIELTAGTDLVIKNGIISINTNGIANSSDYSFVEGDSSSAIGGKSHAEGYHTSANAAYSHTEGFKTSAAGNAAHAEGNITYAAGNASHAEGSETSAFGVDLGAHSEGYQTLASGKYSHSEGGGTSALKIASHAEGYCTLASGQYSHAEGQYTSAKGNASHAEGYRTIASDNYMHVGGKYNSTSSNAAFVIGKGTDESTRSDAFVVDWTGVASAVNMKTSAGQVIATNSTPTDGQVLTYDGTNNSAVWSTAGGSSNIIVLTGTGSNQGQTVEIEEYPFDDLITAIKGGKAFALVLNGPTPLTPTPEYGQPETFIITEWEFQTLGGQSILIGSIGDIKTPIGIIGLAKSSNGYIEAMFQQCEATMTLSNTGSWDGKTLNMSLGIPKVINFVCYGLPNVRAYNNGQGETPTKVIFICQKCKWNSGTPVTYDFSETIFFTVDLQQSTISGGYPYEQIT